jgi:CRP-like cAMP-binding protein
MIVIMSDLLNHLCALPSALVRLTAGEMVFHRHDPVRGLFVVEEGLAHLVRYQLGGAATVMQRAGPGDLLAEASLFAEHYHCDAVAMAETKLRRFAIRDMQRAMREQPSFAQAYAKHLAHEMHRMRVRAEILAMRTVRARLDAWLSLQDLPPKGAWGILADDIGVSREALYRELARRSISRARKQRAGA